MLFTLVMVFLLVLSVSSNDEGNPTFVVGRVYERIEIAFGAAAAKSSLRIVVREAARSRLAVTSRGGFADKTGCEMLEEAAQCCEAAAHDEKVGFDEAIKV
jgi:hypothetical protein